jgi:hypothetical protein
LKTVESRDGENVLQSGDHLRLIKQVDAP